MELKHKQLELKAQNELKALQAKEWQLKLLEWKLQEEENWKFQPD